MRSLPEAPPGAFTWALGIEDTCVYPAGDNPTALDEYELTGHRVSWREDLVLAKSLGATSVRYGVSWPLVHTGPHEFDWRSLDEVVDFAAHELGLELIADLVHYGTPPWLTDSFIDPRYPDAIEVFARELASRYRGSIRQFTPLNEPITTASFCGLRGVWPPALTGWEGWVAVAVPISLGIVRAVRAIREVQPHASIVHVEASSLIFAGDPDLAAHADLLRMVGWLPTDLMLGRVHPGSAEWEWLLKHGASPEDLHWLLANDVVPDVMGVNYYPDLTPRRLESVSGEVVQVSHNRSTEGLRDVLNAFEARYALPLMITETSIEGSDEVRQGWFEDSARAVQEMRQEGHDIRGYTWWPLFDFVDWSWASDGENVEEFAVAVVDGDGAVRVGPAPSLGHPRDGKEPFLRRMGLVRLEEQPDGSLARVPTMVASAFARVARGKT